MGAPLTYPPALSANTRSSVHIRPPSGYETADDMRASRYPIRAAIGFESLRVHALVLDPTPRQTKEPMTAQRLDRDDLEGWQPPLADVGATRTERVA